MLNNNPNNYNPMMFYMMLNMMNNMNPGMGYNVNNYNINNAQNNMALMMNWMNMYPILFQMYQNTMNNQNFNMNQFNNNNNDNSFNNKNISLVRVSEQDLNQAKVTGGGVLPKKMPNNTTIDLSPPFDTNLKTNIAFTTQKGQKVIIVCPVNMKMKDLFVNYITRLGLGPNVLGDSIFFLFNGSKINKNDTRTVGELGLISGSNIVVLDINGVIGS